MANGYFYFSTAPWLLSSCVTVLDIGQSSNPAPPPPPLTRAPPGFVPGVPAVRQHLPPVPPRLRLRAQGLPLLPTLRRGRQRRPRGHRPHCKLQTPTRPPCDPRAQSGPLPSLAPCHHRGRHGDRIPRPAGQEDERAVEDEGRGSGWVRTDDW